MGVVNITPDSFSDGGRLPDTAAAVRFAQQLVADGADILDIGGEATNPHATSISADEELARVLPVIAALVASGVVASSGPPSGLMSGPVSDPLSGPVSGPPAAGRTVALSIDTTKAEVARAAVVSGVRYVNDVSGGLFDPDMSETMAGLDATYICGHLRGRTIREVFLDENRACTWTEVADELAARLARLPDAVRARAWIDPGIGFGKGADPTTNMELLRHAGDLGRRLGHPVVVGPSRKRFLRTLLGHGPAAGADPSELDLDRETVRVSLEAVRAGAHVIRVHNVALLHAALTAYNSM
jgi:dihydropteroate synthase